MFLERATLTSLEATATGEAPSGSAVSCPSLNDQLSSVFLATWLCFYTDT